MYMYRHSLSITSNTPFIKIICPFYSLTEACSNVYIYIHVYVAIWKERPKATNDKIGLVDLFFCLRFFALLEKFALIWRRHHYRWRAATFDLYSAVMVIGQRGFFSVATYCDAVHPSPRTRDIHTFAKRSPDLMTNDWDSNTQPSAWEANAPTDCSTAAASLENEGLYYNCMVLISLPHILFFLYTYQINKNKFKRMRDGSHISWNRNAQQ